jgi:hypothetical protein
LLSRESTGHTFLLQRAIIATIKAVEEMVLKVILIPALEDDFALRPRLERPLPSSLRKLAQHCSISYKHKTRHTWLQQLTCMVASTKGPFKICFATPAAQLSALCALTEAEKTKVPRTGVLHTTVRMNSNTATSHPPSKGASEANVSSSSAGMVEHKSGTSGDFPFLLFSVRPTGVVAARFLDACFLDELAAAATPAAAEGARDVGVARGAPLCEAGVAAAA